ncbi:MAG: SufD family Fe-S cluster assembly protein [Candidatus Poseidoniales archaeon]
MSTYLEIPIPPSSDHLWRYTPWKRVHPSAVNTIPDAQPLTISGGDLFKAVITDSDEIARSFIHSIAQCQELVLADEDLVIDVKSSGHVAAGELKIVAKGHNTLVINLMGEASWAGLRIVGEVLPASSLSIALINELSSESRLLRVEDWVVGKDASLEFSTLSAGGSYCKTDIRVNLTAKGSECRGSVAIHGTGKRHDDHHFEINHAAGYTTSGLVMHAACDDKSRSIGTGLLKIETNCDGSNAGQIFRNLLLSEKSRAESIPELEVLSDDVKAAHGAASAPVSAEQLHYLMSRGLTKSAAEALIVEGFLMDAFKDIRNKKVVAAMRNALLLHLDCLVI